MLQVRRGTSAALIAENHLLEQGRPCFAIDTFEFCIGTGLLHYVDLPKVTIGALVGAITVEDVLPVADDVTRVAGQVWLCTVDLRMYACFEDGTTRVLATSGAF